MNSGLGPDELRALWAEDEGARRDIYIEDTNAEEWQAVLDAVLGRWPSSYTEDGEPSPLPCAPEILMRRSDRNTHLEVHLADHFGVDVHFFEDSQIEFTFNPENVRDDADVYRILDLVSRAGRAVQRAVHMTTESHSGDRPADDLSYDPAQDRIVRPAES